MLRFVVSNPETRHRLERREAKRQQVPFHELYESLGILDFGELNAEQVLALVAAKNFGMTIDLLGIPEHKNAPSGADDQRIDVPQMTIGPSVKEFLSSVPASDYDFDVLTDPEQVPMAVPEDLMLRRRAPREFLRKMTEGELMRFAWLEHEIDLMEDLEMEQEQDERLPEPPPDAPEGVFGHLLLDASESMGWGRDLRNIAARGLAIAFVLAQREAGNPVYMHLFRAALEEELAAEDPTHCGPIAAAILTHDHYGMTGLQQTLEELAPRLEQSAERVDIVLITDGLTRLKQNPLGIAHLHTFLLGDQTLDRDKSNIEQAKDAEDKLVEWGDFFFEVSPEVMLEACVPLRADVLGMEHVLDSLEEDIRGAATSAFVQQVWRRAQNLHTMVRAYREAHGGRDEAIDALWERVETIVRQHRQSDATAIAMENTAGWNQVDRDAAIALEDREVRSILHSGGGPVELAKTLKGSQEAVSFWRAILLLLKSLRRRRGAS